MKYISILEPQIKKQNGTLKSEKIVNGNNIEYDIDLVIRNFKEEIISIIETKFIRYKKHNRDKGSWISSTHNNLRHSHPTITGCFAVLGGNWSKPSLEMIQNSGVQTVLVESEHIADVYSKYGVNIRWGEKDDYIKKKAYEDEMNLTDMDRKNIGDEMIEDILPALDNIVKCLS